LLALQNCATDTSMPKKSKDASSDVPPADLYWAARHGSELRIRAALEKGAAVDALFDGRPALVVAALSDQPHAVAALLEAGATVDLAEDGTSLTPLASAVIEGSLKCAERLADAGADLERADADGLTPLMHAALHGRADEAHLLLKRGASPDAKAGGVDARQLASVQGHDRVIWAIDAELKRRADAAAEKAAAERAAKDAAAAAEAAAERAAALDPTAPAPKRMRASAPEIGRASATRLEVIQEDDYVVVKLHGAEIVRLDEDDDGTLTLSSGGWQTVSTLEAINGSVAELLPDLNLELRNVQGEWALVHKTSGNSRPFADGLAIPTKADDPLAAAKAPDGTPSQSPQTNAAPAPPAPQAQQMPPQAGMMPGGGLAGGAAMSAMGGMGGMCGGMGMMPGMCGGAMAGMGGGAMGGNPQQRLLQQQMMMSMGRGGAMGGQPNMMGGMMGGMPNMMGGMRPMGMMGGMGMGMGGMGGMGANMGGMQPNQMQGMPNQMQNPMGGGAMGGGAMGGGTDPRMQ
jgi:hypothetical protein